jgi:predicted nucleic acid-binding protein
MESALLGLVLDSSTVIRAERNRQSIADFIDSILQTHGPVDLSLSPVTVAELVHGIYRAKTPEAARRRREYIEGLVSLVPVHPATKQTAWLAGQIEGQEAAKGNVVPFNDLLIAAAAIEQGYAVLTGNLRHFQKNSWPHGCFLVTGHPAARQSLLDLMPCGTGNRGLDMLQKPVIRSL